MNQILLRQEMERLFNREELRTLSFDLEIDYENFPETKEGMVRELIIYCERHNRLGHLAMRLRQLRTDLDWDEVFRADDGAVPTEPEA